MTFQRSIRYLVIFVSLIIFCYQLHVALEHLLSIQTVDSTEYIPISDLESPPIITFCPRQVEDEKSLWELGYFNTENLMQGNIRQTDIHKCYN